ncbi:biotin/lipoyl-containing protein [Deltaproteobacteria bacterium TL4]
MRKYEISVNNRPYKVEVKSFTSEAAEVEINGKTYDVHINSIESAGSTSPAPRILSSTSKAATVPVHTSPSAGTGQAGALRAPIPGSIMTILVKVGDKVIVGQKVLKMEAMKMENEISAQAAGTIKTISVKPGDTVSQGQELLMIG